MDDKNKQTSWDFSQLQESLERYFNTPERLLLEAYKGLTFFVSNMDNDTDVISVKENIFPIEMILNDVYNAIEKKEMEELNLKSKELRNESK